LVISDDPGICPLSGLAINKSISVAIATVGETIAYIITLQNLNQFDLYNIYAQESLPIGS